MFPLSTGEGLQIQPETFNQSIPVYNIGLEMPFEAQPFVEPDRRDHHIRGVQVQGGGAQLTGPPGGFPNQECSNAAAAYVRGDGKQAQYRGVDAKLGLAVGRFRRGEQQCAADNLLAISAMIRANGAFPCTESRIEFRYASHCGSGMLKQNIGCMRTAALRQWLRAHFLQRHE